VSGSENLQYEMLTSSHNRSCMINQQSSLPVKSAELVVSSSVKPSLELREFTEPLQNTNITRPNQTIAALEQRICQFAQKRGEMLVKLITRKNSDEQHADVLEKINALDHRFSCFASTYAEVLRADTIQLERLAESARVVQDSAIYTGLKARFFSLGKDLGEAQGRIVDIERINRTNGIIKTLEDRIGQALTGSGVPTKSLSGEPAALNGPNNTLTTALRAALGQGERVGIDNRIAAETDAAHIYRNIAGWKEYLPTWFPFFKPFQAVQALLADKDSAQIGYINEALEKRRGIGLKEALIEAYGKKYETRIRWLTEGDAIGGAALSAARELGSFFSTKRSRGEGLREIYESLPITEIARFEKLLANELKVEESKLTDYVASKITLRAAQKLHALRPGSLDPAERLLTEQAIHLADLLESKGGRLLQARWVMRDLAINEIDEFSEIYKRQNGQSLRSALETKLPASAARDFCLAVVDQDQERITAAQIKCSFSYRADWIGAPFLRISEEESLAKRAAYCRVYHADLPEEQGFWQDLKRAAWKEDYSVLSKIPPLCAVLDKLWWPFTNSHPFLESIVLNGELSPEERLRYYMVGIGTDIDGIYTELENLSNKEFAEVDRKYQQRYFKGNFTKLVAQIPVLRDFFLIGKTRHDLRVELSGDHEFDISLLLEGLPSDGDERKLCHTKLDHLNRRYEHERSGILLKNGLLNRWRGDAVVLKGFIEDYRVAVSYFHKYLDKQPVLNPEHIKRFCTLVRIAETQADAYRDAKVTVSALVLNSGAAIGATLGAIGVLMFSSLPWWSAAVASGCGSLCWRWGQGNLLLGRGFGKTDATFQAIRAFIDGASMFTVRVGVATIGTLVGRQISSGVAKGGFKTSLNKFIQSVENSIKRQDKARHLIEKGTLIASDDELAELTEGFYKEIATNPNAVGSEKLTEGRRIEDTFLRALMELSSGSSNH
jgi:hypothetical protein